MESSQPRVAPRGPGRPRSRRVVGPVPPDRYLLARPRPVPGNRVEVCEDGHELFPAMLAAIAGARSWITFQTYILKSDRTGWRFAEALRERARAGVRVRLVYDALGSRGIDERLSESCRQDGVEVRVYHPLSPWRRRWAWLSRDHRKVLVVDGRIAFAGSQNIDDCHLPVALGGEGWHDLALKVEGPAAGALASLFEQSWRRAYRWRDRIRLRPWRRRREQPPPPTPGPPLYHPDGIPLQVVGHQPLLDRFRVRRAHLRAFRLAQARIRLMHSYFVPDRAVIRALCDAARAGVEVELVLPARSDHLVVDLASRYLFEQLLLAGVRIWLWERGVLHAKAAVVDGVWASVGSYNFDALSMAFNLEVSLMAADPGLAAELDLRFERDRQACRALAHGEWAKRPRSQRMLEWAAYQLRRWL